MKLGATLGKELGEALGPVLGDEVGEELGAEVRLLVERNHLGGVGRKNPMGERARLDAGIRLLVERNHFGIIGAGCFLAILPGGLKTSGDVVR
jgi:hypothetical protein